MGRWSGRQLTSAMLSEPYVASLLLFLALLNPFMMSVYLIDLITDLRRELFVRVLLRGALISGAVFAVFAWSGDAIFSDVLQVRFASFQIFGGIVFLLIGARLVLTGADAMRAMRGQPEHIAGSIAATETSAVTFISIPAISYARGGNLELLQLALGYVIGRLVISVIFIPSYFRGELQSVYELLGVRFGVHSRRAASAWPRS